MHCHALGPGAGYGNGDLVRMVPMVWEVVCWFPSLPRGRRVAVAVMAVVYVRGGELPLMEKGEGGEGGEGEGGKKGRGKGRVGVAFLHS